MQRVKVGASRRQKQKSSIKVSTKKTSDSQKKEAKLNKWQVECFVRHEKYQLKFKFYRFIKRYQLKINMIVVLMVFNNAVDT